MVAENDRSWIARSIPAGNGQVEVRFLLKNDFYIGDEENYLNDQNNAVPLQSPAIKNAGEQYLTSKAVQHHETELAGYYKSVLNHARIHGKAVDQIRQYFWMRLVLSGDGVELRFPWYDTWDEMDVLLQWLLSANEGDFWGDIEQGWELAIIRAGSHMYMREGNGEGEEFENVVFARDALIQSIVELRARIPNMLAKLSREIGADYWTNQPKFE